MKINYKQMKRTILISLLVVCSSYCHGVSLEKFFLDTDRFLQTYVTNGEVDYKKIRRQAARIQQLYQDIGKISLENKSRDEIKAFYLNAYNIIVIHETLFNKKYKKLLKTGKFFKEVRHTINGQDLTLEKLERNYLLLKFRDPRIYFYLGHSTRGKSQFQEFAISPQKIQEQLESLSIRG